MILDAGCGNRAMWQHKDNSDIVFIDIEKQLTIKPDLFASNTTLPFTAESFDTVFFDPPFKWNCGDHPFFSFPNVQMRNAMYPDIKDNRKVTGYYGIERYKTRSALVSYIFRAERELRRILKPDGILWVRWCNMTSMTEKHVLGIFKDWHHCLTHEINSSKQTTSDIGSWWFMLMKGKQNFTQRELI